MSGEHEAAASTAPAAAAPRRADGADLGGWCGVWVYVELERGRVHPVSWELLGEGRKLAAGRALSLSFDHDWALMLLRCEDGGIAVTCGCRWFDSPAAARAHWQAHEEQQRRDVVIPALDLLLVQARTQGWAVPAEERPVPERVNASEGI